MIIKILLLVEGFMFGVIFRMIVEYKRNDKWHKLVEEKNKELSAQREFDLYDENIKATLI